jgi:hypothetical protein
MRRPRQRFLTQVLVQNHGTGRREELTVDSDAHQITYFLHLATRQPKGSEIPQDEMTVGATRLKLVTMFDERGSEGAGVGDHLLGVSAERGLSDLQKSSRDGGDGLTGSF